MYWGNHSEDKTTRTKYRKSYSSAHSLTVFAIRNSNPLPGKKPSLTLPNIEAEAVGTLPRLDRSEKEKEPNNAAFAPLESSVSALT